METLKVTIFRPGKTFPTISVTGNRCDLMCTHCKGEHLKTMIPATTSQELLRIATELKENKGKGMLISGGCDVRGKVPVPELSETITKIKKIGLDVNVHTGHLTKEEAKRLVDAGVDAFSMDVHQDPIVIRNVLNIDDPGIYATTMENIIANNGKMIPHVTIGFGADDLMMSADLLKDMDVTDITVLGLMETRNTDVVDVSFEGMIDAIRMLMEMGFTVTLGCMRPRSHIFEIECIRMGVNRIANPSLKTVKWLIENGHSVETIEKCCCFIS